jgi:hypothetical protein
MRIEDLSAVDRFPLALALSGPGTGPSRAGAGTGTLDQAVAAKVSSAVTGQPADADRWAHRVGRWQFQDVARHDDPAAEAWATLLRLPHHGHGVEQMRADAHEAAWRFTTEETW